MNHVGSAVVGVAAIVGVAVTFSLLSEPTWVELSLRNDADVSAASGAEPTRVGSAALGELPAVPPKSNEQQIHMAVTQELAATPRPTPTRIRVVVRLRNDARTVALPEPELLRLDEHGQPWPVAAKEPRPTRRHPALVLASRHTHTPGDPPQRQLRQQSRTFEVTRPGRYVAAWHLWMNVEGTRTWRVCRGRGPEILLSGGEPAQELVVDVGAAELALNPSLDMRATSARTTVTAKDG